MAASGLVGAASAVALLLAVAAAAAEEAPAPLALTVNPSGFEPAPGSLEEKLARRLRESDYLFRSICRGCGRHEALAEAGGGAFEPQRSLAATRAR